MKAPNKKPKKPLTFPLWKRDDMGDYIICLDRHAKELPVVSGRIVHCPIIKKHNRFWRTDERWLLMVNGQFYGFWKSLTEAITRFEQDCIPNDSPVDDDLDEPYFCWHKEPCGPGPYCTGCGGFIPVDSFKNSLISK